MSSFIKAIFLDSPPTSPNAESTSQRRISREIERKVEESGSVKQALADLIEINENFHVACGDAVDLIYPLLERVQASLAKKESEEYKEFNRTLNGALEKLDMLRVLVESSEQEKVVIPKKVEMESKRETIHTTKIELQMQLAKLNAIMVDELVTGDARQAVGLKFTLDKYKEHFNDIVRDLQAPLRKMGEYLKSFKCAIDFLKANPIPESSHSPISQYMIFLNNDLIDGFNHEIKTQMGDLVNVMGIDVERHIDLIAKKVKEWEGIYDGYTTTLVQIENCCRKIEWKLHLRQFHKNLKPEICAMMKTVKDLEEGIETQVRLLKKDRENSLEGAKIEVERFMATYNTQTRSAIEELNKKIGEERKALQLLQTENSQESSDAIMSRFHFYDSEACEKNKEQLRTSLAQSLKEVTVTLNEMEVQWDEEFKPFNEKVVGNLNVLASSVLTKKGEIRTGVFYSIKEVAGYNTKRVSLPNYEMNNN